MQSTSDRASLRKASVQGVIWLDDESYTVDLPPELLFVDAIAWFEARGRWATLNRGTDQLTYGGVTPNSVSETKAQLSDNPLLLAKDEGDVFVRARMMPWRVKEDLPSLRHFARTLLEFGMVPEREDDLDFLLRINSHRQELWLTPDLRAQAEFAAPFRANVVRRSILEPMAGRIR